MPALPGKREKCVLQLERSANGIADKELISHQAVTLRTLIYQARLVAT